jgi:hypothetical protein
MNGDWLLIMNLHMEPSWMSMIEELILALGPDTNPRFRLWMTMPQMDHCSDLVLKRSVKVALEQPVNIKMKIERHLEQQKEANLKRYGDLGTMHKNVFFGLCYLHGVLDGRRAYHSLGWNVSYIFDKNDFDLSD